MPESDDQEPTDEEHRQTMYLSATNRKPLAILIIGLNYAPETTGIAPYTTGLARHLASSGYQVTAITGFPHYPGWRLHKGYETTSSQGYDHGVKLIRVPHPIPRNPSGISRAWMEMVFAGRSVPHINKCRPDIVITVSPAMLSIVPALLMRRRLRYRLGVIVQDLYGAALTETGIAGEVIARIARHLEMLLLRHADGVSVIHDVFRQRLIAEGIDSSKIEVIANWTHVEVPAEYDREHTRKSLGWADNEFIALHAGNMGTKQGLEGLIDVARRAGDLSSPVRIVLMGDGSRRQALEQYARDVPSVTLMDPLPAGEFELALAAADCLLLHEKPGVAEMSVPSKLTTYFASGRPVVAATDSRSGASALMHQAKAGTVVTAGEPTAILAAIEDLAADPASATEMGRNGRDFAEAQLSSTSLLQRTEGWLARLIDG